METSTQSLKPGSRIKHNGIIEITGEHTDERFYTYRKVVKRNTPDEHLSGNEYSIYKTVAHSSEKIQ